MKTESVSAMYQRADALSLQAADTRREYNKVLAQIQNARDEVIKQFDFAFVEHFGERPKGSDAAVKEWDRDREVWETAVAVVSGFKA